MLYNDIVCLLPASLSLDDFSVLILNNVQTGLHLGACACRACVVGRKITLFRNQDDRNEVMFLYILPLRYPYFRALFIIIFIIVFFFNLCAYTESSQCFYVCTSTYQFVIISLVWYDFLLTASRHYTTIRPKIISTRRVQWTGKDNGKILFHVKNFWKNWGKSWRILALEHILSTRVSEV